jgi:hypothetical protein
LKGFIGKDPSPQKWDWLVVGEIFMPYSEVLDIMADGQSFRGKQILYRTTTDLDSSFKLKIAL